MVSLSWKQVNAWRLTQHRLLEPAPRRQMLDVVSHIGGVHAQLMPAAELALSARVQDLAPDEVPAALWDDRTLIKTWVMRGTLHLVTAGDFPLYVGALSTLRHFRRPSWLKYHGVTLEELEAIIEAVRATLHGSGMTREQLAEAIVERLGQPALRELLQSGWGALLKPAAFQGYLCYGPDEGQNVTFVHPDEWLGDWHPVESEVALQEIARRYLTAYGPATTDEFSRWLGVTPSQAKRVFRSLGDEIAAVEVEGWEAWALTATVEGMQALDESHSVRLLAHFDPYVYAVYRHCEYLLPEGQKSRVYRPQGWIMPVVLVDGRLAGVREYDRQNSQMDVRVELFAPPIDRIQRGIDAEATRLGAFLDTDVDLVYTHGDN